jgi:hypothetical protein
MIEGLASAADSPAEEAPFPVIVTRLRRLVGPRLVGYIGSVRNTGLVHRWAGGECEPAEAVQQRLRLALQVAATLSETDSPRIAQAWLQGLNPQLEDRSPARWIREGDPREVGPAVIRAARTFLVGG